jgi:hypothetical protein
MLTKDLCLLRSVIRAGNQTRWIAESECLTAALPPQVTAKQIF